MMLFWEGINSACHMQWISNDIKATELASHMQELRSHSNGNHGQGLTYKNRSMGRENRTTLILQQPYTNIFMGII